MNNAFRTLLDYNPNDAVRQFAADLTHYSIPHGLRYFTSNDNVYNAKREWAVDLLILRCMQSSSLSPHPRSEKVLQEALKQYKAENPSCTLTLTDLLNGGWVRIVWGAWYIPFEFIMFKGRVDENSPHLYQFLRVLSNMPYPDTRKIVTDNISQIREGHCRVYATTPTLERLVELEIISEIDGMLCLNPDSPYVSAFVPQLLAKLWEEVHCGPRDPNDRLSWWIQYAELFHYGYQFPDYLEPPAREEFLDACRDRLLKEQDLVGWSEELHRMAAEALSMNGQTVVDDYISHFKLPVSGLDKLFWMEHGPESALHIDRPREQLSLLYHWIVGWESVNRFDTDRPRLMALLKERDNRPFFYKELRSACSNFPSIIPFLLRGADTLELGAALLTVFRVSFPGSNFSAATQVETDRVNEQLWNKGLTFIGDTLKRLPDQEAVSSIVNLTAWLTEQSRKKRHSLGIDKKRIEEFDRKWISFLYMIASTPIYSNSQETLLVRLYIPMVRFLTETLEDKQAPIVHQTFPLLLWLIERQLDSGVFGDSARNAMRKAADLYVKSISFSASDPWFEERAALIVEHPSWILIAEWLQRTSGETLHYLRFISPFQVNSELAQRPDDSESRYNWSKTLNVKLRTHLRLLANILVYWPGQFDSDIPREITSAFENLFLDMLQKAHLLEIHPFADSLGQSPTRFSAPVGRDLLELTAQAIDRLPQQMRESLINAIVIFTRDPRILSKLYNKLTWDKDRAHLLDTLKGLLTEDRLTDVLWLTEVQMIIHELLNTENPELAQLALSYLDKHETPGLNRQLSGWKDWAFRERLRADFIRGDYKSTLDRALDSDESKERRNTLLFYQALACLQLEDETKLRRSIATFRDLRQQEPLTPSYTVNWLVACVRLYKLLSDKRTSESTLEIKELVRETNAVLKIIDTSFTEEQIEDALPIIVSNRLYFLYMSAETEQFWNIYFGLPEKVRLALPNGLYAVRKHMDQGEWGSASELLDLLSKWHGNFEGYAVLLHDIQSRNTLDYVVPSPESYVILMQNWTTISTAIANIKTLRAEEQVKALTNQSGMTVERFLLDIVLDVCRRVVDYSPNLTPAVDQPAEEDRYTDLFALLLNQRLLSLGWQADTQPRGGYTKKEVGRRGGIGERDLIIRCNLRNELMLGEALVLKDGNKANILKHVEKTFGYDTTNCNYHVLLVWGFSDKPDLVWGTYKNLAVDRKEGEFQVLDSGDLNTLFEEVDEQGLRVFYTRNKTDIDGRIATVIHIYADVLHAKKRQIADSARAH